MSARIAYEYFLRCRSGHRLLFQLLSPGNSEKSRGSVLQVPCVSGLRPRPWRLTPRQVTHTCFCVWGEVSLLFTTGETFLSKLPSGAKAPIHEVRLTRPLKGRSSTAMQLHGDAPAQRCSGTEMHV